MAPRRDKDFYRDLKRCIKKAGNKKRRQFLKKNLDENPEEAHLHNDFDFGEYSSEIFNGMDNDATRRREEPPKSDTETPNGETPAIDSDFAV